VHLQPDDRFVASAHVATVYHEKRAKLAKARRLVRASRDVSSSLTLFTQRVLPIAMLILALVSVPILILEPQGLPRLKSLERELADVNGESDELKRDIGKLRIEVRELRDNPAAVERIARDQLGLVRKSEVVFQFGKTTK
jgi:cell division protein FtsB